MMGNNDMMMTMIHNDSDDGSERIQRGGGGGGRVSGYILGAGKIPSLARMVIRGLNAG